jgi:hypothetical protein
MKIKNITLRIRNINLEDMVVLIGEDLSHATNTNITGDDEQALTGDKKTSTNRGVTI